MRVERQLLHIVLCAILLIGLSGCSTVYRQHWRRAADLLDAQHPAVGRWEGTWLSHKNQHTGKLRCIVQRTDEGRYDFHYWATWQWFAATYHLDLTATSSAQGVQLRGEKNLGKLAGGLYTFEGTIIEDDFEATYTSTGDHGVFRMQRVEQ